MTILHFYGDVAYFYPNAMHSSRYRIVRKKTRHLTRNKVCIDRMTVLIYDVV